MSNRQATDIEQATLRPLLRLTMGTFLVLTLVTLSGVYQRFDALEDRLHSLEQQLGAEGETTLAAALED